MRSTGRGGGFLLFCTCPWIQWSYSLWLAYITKHEPTHSIPEDWDNMLLQSITIHPQKLTVPNPQDHNLNMTLIIFIVFKTDQTHSSCPVVVWLYFKHEEGEWRYSSCLPKLWVVDGWDEWNVLMLIFGEKAPDAHWIRSWVDQNAGLTQWRKEKSQLLLKISPNSLIILQVASLLTNYMELNTIRETTRC
jgi:hypothetical protein